MNKKIKFSGLILGFVFLLGLGFTACSDDDEKTPGFEAGEVELKVDQKFLQFLTPEASEQALKINCNVVWNAKSTASWCKLSQEEGDGDTELTVSVTKNSAMSSRTAQILVTADNAHRDTVEVVQFGEQVEYVIYVDNNRLERDTFMMDCVVGKVDVTVMSNVDFNMQYPRSDWFELYQLDQMTAFDKFHYYELRLADNTGDVRYGALLFQQQNGKFADTIHFGQRAFSPELRVNETICLGSHFKVAEFMITSLGVTDFEYKFEDESGKQPEWLRNFELIKCTEFTNHAGQRYYLRGECGYNNSSESRTCTMSLTYKHDGKDVVVKSNIVQLPWNGRASDSLVLLSIVGKNTVPAYGINLAWDLATPVIQWERTKWIEDADGFQRLHRMALGQVWICYDLTADLGNLSELVELNMVKNFISGPLPKELALCEKLETIDLFDNYNDVLSYTPSGEASGITSFPGEIFEKCTNLKHVDVAVNSIKTIPAEINQAVNLEYLDFGSNDVESLGTLNWSNLVNLKSLRLVYLRKYKGPFFDFIFQVPSLEEIAFSRTDFDGAVLPQDGWEKLPNLQRIEMATCHLTGQLPKSLAQCKKLREVDFNSGDEINTFPVNKLDGELPAEYGEAFLEMERFDISGNQITGSIPASYAKWFDLWTRTSPNRKFMNLAVNGNRMSGSIPDAILQHDVWTGKIANRTDSEGKQVSCAIGDLVPEVFICPQQENYGFDNCK